MNYMYKIENLDCANCAAKVEAAVSKIEGVNTCSVNFFALKMKLETESEMTDDLFKTIQKTIKKIESDMRIKAV